MEIKLLYKEKTPENIIAHSKAVCNKAMEIASHFENVEIDFWIASIRLSCSSVIPCGGS